MTVLNPAKLACALLLLICGVGCATSVTTLQSARTIDPGDMQITTSASVPVASSVVRGAFDTAKSVVDRFDDISSANTPPTEDELRNAVEAATAYVLFTPSVYPELMARRGIIDRFDAGLRLSNSLAKFEMKGQFLKEDSGAAGSAFIGYGYHFGVGPSIAEKLFDIFEYLDMVDYARHDLDVGVLFGFEKGEWLSFYAGPRFLTSFTKVKLNLKGFEQNDVIDVPEAINIDTPIIHVGAVVGIMLGYKYVFVNLEMTMLYVIFKPEVLGETLDLGGMMFAPTIGLTAKF